MSVDPQRSGAALAAGEKSGAVPRYGAVSMLLHWTIAAGIVAQASFGFLLDDIAPRGTPSRGEVINLHKSIGLVLLLLVALRLAWRLRQRPPPWPAAMPAWQQRAALAGHRLLYATMLLLPISGAIASNFSRHGIRFFGWRWAPLGPDLPAVYDFFNGLHVAAAFTLAALVAGHVAMAFKHAWLDRDGVFDRMWPAATRRGPRHFTRNPP